MPSLSPVHDSGESRSPKAFAAASRERRNKVVDGVSEEDINKIIQECKETGQNDLFQCPYCECVIMRKLSNFRQHLLTHTSVTSCQFVCGCSQPRVFSAKGTFTRHVKTKQCMDLSTARALHNDDRHYSSAGESIEPLSPHAKLVGIRSHKNRSGYVLVANEWIRILKNDDRIPKNCPICGQNHPSINDLHEHILESHTGSAEERRSRHLS